MKIISVVGARPNFVKIAPFFRAIESYNKELERHTTHDMIHTSYIDHVLVHTGQHYDNKMSDSFFEHLGIAEANINLGIGSGSHAEQVGQTMIEFEKVLKREKPDWVVVIGDVNATLACSVTAKKERIKCCHIEAGLRSGDITMPEEINRLVTDRICDLLLTPDLISTDNLRKEGVSESKIRFVGNIMIDTLDANYIKASKLEISDIITRNLFREPLPPPDSYRDALHPLPVRFAVITLHRPSNVDKKEDLEPIVNFLTNEVCAETSLLWPIHPRAKKMLEEFELFEKLMATPNLILLEPLGYLEMLRLNMSAQLVLTDSGGLQEECTVLGTPCLTLRWNTERPVTLKEYGGASVLVGNNIDRIRGEYQTALLEKRNPIRPELWDGHTAERCLRAILDYRE